MKFILYINPLYPFTFGPHRSKDGARMLAKSPVNRPIFHCAFDTPADSQVNVDTVGFFFFHILFDVECYRRPGDRVSEQPADPLELEE